MRLLEFGRNYLILSLLLFLNNMEVCMSDYLMIENPGVAPIQGYLLFGATSKRHSGDNRIIGTFGSGNKHGLALLLRKNIDPVVFCGTTRLSFSKQPETFDSVTGPVSVDRVVVRVTGKDIAGKSLNYTKELDHTLSYGSADWTDTAYGLREFVSNSIDACYEQDKDYKEVVLKIVEEGQVRARSGYTRVFVPVTEDVMKFYLERGKWFLHFSEPQNLDNPILSKKDRNRLKFGEKVSRNAVIYRRGVLVREYSEQDEPSLFDYNLTELEMNESRTNNDFQVRYACAKVLHQMNDEQKIAFLKGIEDETEYWESRLDSYYTCLKEYYSNYDDHISSWGKAIKSVFGEKSCFTSNMLFAVSISERGYRPVIVRNNNIREMVKSLGGKMDDAVLSKDMMDGREIIPSTAAVEECLDEIWDKICSVNLNYAKEKPPVFCFRLMSHASATVNGYYCNNKVYIHSDLSEAITDKLRDVMVEELAHYVTGATDGSRDFANYLIRFAVEMSKKSS